MYRIGVAEEIVHIAQNFLIGSDEEYTEVVRLALLQRVDRQDVTGAAHGDEIRHLSVAVAGNVLQSGVACRTFVKPLDRHDWEKLVYRPAVRERLEEREVAEVLVCQQLVHVPQFIGDVLHVLGKTVDLMAHTPVHRLNLGTCLQIHHAVGEQLQCLLADLFGIVPVLQHIA